MIRFFGFNLDLLDRVGLASKPRFLSKGLAFDSTAWNRYYSINLDPTHLTKMNKNPAPSFVSSQPETINDLVLLGLIWSDQT